MTELKLCAFCGSANVVAIEPAAGYPSSDLFKYSYVHCDDCHADGPPDLGISGAIERYNTRPIEDALRAEIAALQAENDMLKKTASELAKSLITLRTARAEKAEAERDTALARLSDLENGRPMEEAPRDGTVILVRDEDNNVCARFFMDGRWYVSEFIYAMGESHCLEWWPLPGSQK